MTQTQEDVIRMIDPADGPTEYVLLSTTEDPQEMADVCRTEAEFEREAAEYLREIAEEMLDDDHAIEFLNNLAEYLEEFSENTEAQAKAFERYGQEH